MSRKVLRKIAAEDVVINAVNNDINLIARVLNSQEKYMVRKGSPESSPLSCRYSPNFPSRLPFEAVVEGAPLKIDNLPHLKAAVATKRNPEKEKEVASFQAQQPNAGLQDDTYTSVMEEGLLQCTKTPHAPASNRNNGFHAKSNSMQTTPDSLNRILGPL